jgi:hypothetical protein
MDNQLYDDIQNLIDSIDWRRDTLEQKYYRDKQVLCATYETSTALLLEQKVFLKNILSDCRERNIEKSENEDKQTIYWIDLTNWVDRTCKVEWEMKGWVLNIKSIDYC